MDAPSNSLSLPGNAFTLWTVRAIVDSGTRLPEPEPPAPLKLPALAFTLWLDPGRWPVPRLRLPAAATTLWLDPARWPAPRLRLPGNGTTVWLDPARWPRRRLSLPSGAHTLWLNPERWPARASQTPPRTPVASDSPSPAQPSSVTPPSAPSPIQSAPAMTAPIRIPSNRAFTIWTRQAATIELPPAAGTPAAAVPAPAAAAASAAPRPAAPVSPAPAPSSAPAPAAETAPAALLRLPGDGFTIWAHRHRVQPIPMRNAPARSAAPAAPAAQPAKPPAPAGSSLRWIPLAATLVVAAVLAFKLAAATSQRRELEEKVGKLEGDVINGRNQLNEIRIQLAQTETALQTGKQNLTSRIEELTTRNTGLRDELAAAKLSLQTAETVAREKSAEAERAGAALEAARKESAEQLAALQEKIAALTNDLAALKRTTDAAAVQAKEAMAKLESEKAAAVKAAAEAAAQRDALQRELDVLRAERNSAPAPQEKPAE